MMVGELRCLNCARHLADVVDGEDGRTQLAPPAGQSTAPILVERTTRGMRCTRCGGRALFERLLTGEERRAAASTSGRLTTAA